MKTTHKCPKCEHRRIWVVDPIALRVSAEEVTQLALASAVVTDTTSGGPATRALFGDVERTVTGGRLEAFVCASCGYTEWYAGQLDALETIAKQSDAVRLIDRGSTQAFR